MFVFLIILITIIAILLTLVVLVQSGKGGGLAGIAAGGATTQILGTRQAPDILEKATWVLATAFIVLCILTNFTIDRGAQQESVIQQQAQTEQAAPAQPVVPPPAEGGTQENAPEGGNN
ncbi:MAG: preprotein translocase subunit SecG [Bacteroidetes bacterium]|nr:MAG: preprotein translocase subunit SecG [Bacteroidota bacterium]GIV58348.1 MAG: preprotein translocase subunit SecG [Rhodothermaceae bacterium]